MLKNKINLNSKISLKLKVIEASLWVLKDNKTLIIKKIENISNIMFDECKKYDLTHFKFISTIIQINNQVSIFFADMEQQLFYLINSSNKKDNNEFEIFGIWQ